MLDPKYLRDVPEGIAEYYDELETRILKDIARRISQNDYMMTSTAEYQMHKLEELGVSMLEIEQAISEVLNITDTKVKEIIHDSSYRSVQKDNDMAKAAGIEPPHPDLTQAILNGIRSTNTEIRNICNSMASAANMAFEHALDQAYLSVSSGAFSFADAVKTAVNDLGKNGIRWIDYPTGAHRRADSAIRNALRTGVNQTAARCQEQNLDEMDCNLVETTSHMGARPEHAKWQGMLFWRKTPVNGLQNFYEATGYGTGAGLCGWNCRHNFFPNFDGELSFEHYDEEANAKQYELDQEQRYNERKIREWKRRQAVNKAGGVDTTLECRKVREWQQRQADFLKKHPDMKRNYAREIIEKRSITIKETTVRKNNMLLKGYEKAVNKGDISSFVTFDTYRTTAENIEKELIGLKAKGGIIVLGYKTHFIDRIIGQYESSNEPVKGMRKGVNIQSVKNALKQGTMKTKVDKRTGKKSINYITDECIVSVNPVTKILIQTTPKK